MLAEVCVYVQYVVKISPFFLEKSILKSNE